MKAILTNVDQDVWTNTLPSRFLLIHHQEHFRIKAWKVLTCGWSARIFHTHPAQGTRQFHLK